MSDTSTGWRSRIVGHGEETPDQLLAHPLNARRHPNAQRDAIDASLDAIGWIDPIKVSSRTGHVIDGHARIEQALSRGEATVPVVYVDLTEDEERFALAVYDPISAMAVYDDEALRELLASITVEDAALAAMLAEIATLPGAEVEAPDAFPSYGEDIETAYHCPSCGYEWSGKPS